MIEITDKKEIIIQDDRDGVLTSTYHKGSDNAEIQIQVGTENTSNLNLSAGEARELGGFLLQVARDIANLPT